jgi:hypothetical protein
MLQVGLKTPVFAKPCATFLREARRPSKNERDAFGSVWSGSRGFII